MRQSRVTSVGTAAIRDGAVTGIKLADDAVATRAIRQKAVRTGRIATKAVTNRTLANNSVTSRKIAQGGVQVLASRPDPAAEGQPPVGWFVTFSNLSTALANATAYAVCAHAG